MRPATALAALAVVVASVSSLGGSSAAFTAHSANPGASFSTAADWVAPAVTLTSPAHGSVQILATVLLAGAAGNATGDSTTVTVRIYSGSTATGTPVQTLTPARTGASWTTTSAALAEGTYTAVASQSDSAGNTGTSSANTFTVDTLL